MRNLLLMIALAAVPLAALAVPPPQPPPAQPQPPTMPAAPTEAVEVTEDHLDTFATIYVDMEASRAKLHERAEATESPEEKAEIQQELNQKFVAIIEDNGWTLERYNQVAQTLNADEKLRKRAVELIGEKS